MTQFWSGFLRFKTWYLTLGTPHWSTISWTLANDLVDDLVAMYRACPLRPDATYADAQVQQVFKLFPLPHGVQKAGIQKILKGSPLAGQANATRKRYCWCHVLASWRYARGRSTCCTKLAMMWQCGSRVFQLMRGSVHCHSRTTMERLLTSHSGAWGLCHLGWRVLSWQPGWTHSTRPLSTLSNRASAWGIGLSRAHRRGYITCFQAALVLVPQKPSTQHTRQTTRSLTPGQESNIFHIFGCGVGVHVLHLLSRGSILHVCDHDELASFILFKIPHVLDNFVSRTRWTSSRGSYFKKNQLEIPEKISYGDRRQETRRRVRIQSKPSGLVETQRFQQHRPVVNFKPLVHFLTDLITHWWFC